MNNEMLQIKVHQAMQKQCEMRGYAAPVDVLMDIGVLNRKNYEDWRCGKIPFLEKVCTVNLHKLSFIIKEMQRYAKTNQWKPSVTVYKKWGTRSSETLYFSKSHLNEIERAYATHFLDTGKKA